MKKFSQKFCKNSTGFATLEMLIAMTIMVLSISAVLLLVSGSQDASVNSQTSQEALYKVQDLLSQEKTLASEDFNLVNPLPAPPATSLQDDIYQKNVSVENVNAWTKKVTATVVWQNEAAQTESLDASTIITDPAGFLNGSDVCNSTVTGDWKNPQMTSYSFGKDLLVPSDTTNLYPVTAITTSNNTLFAAVNNTHANTNPTFFTFDISNPNAKPVFLGRVDNALSVSTGLAALTIAGNYAYAANAYASASASCTQNSNCAQLQVIDISNPASPTVIENKKVIASTSGNLLAAGTSIFYSQGYIYLGLAKASGSGSEFNIINVGGGGAPASPTNPIWKGGYSVGSAVNSIFVKNSIAYIATPNSENLIMINVTNPANPVSLGGYSPGSSSNGEAVTVVGTTAYLGRTFGTNEFYILNTINPLGISTFGYKDIGTGSTTSINGIVIKDYLAFLATNSSFEVWNIANPAAIIPWTANFLSLPATAGSVMGCNGDSIYVGSTDSTGNGYISSINSGP